MLSLQRDDKFQILNHLGLGDPEADSLHQLSSRQQLINHLAAESIRRVLLLLDEGIVISAIKKRFNDLLFASV